jgi:hypothetical protein
MDHLAPTMSFALISPNLALQSVATMVQTAFEKGVPPLLIEDGTGGAYFLRSPTHRLVGVFKPSDEEPFAQHNPKQHHASLDPSVTQQPMSMRHGIPVGEMAIRECMAYVADVDHFALVPPTTLAMAQHDGFHTVDIKMGSLQAYCPHDCSAEDMGMSQYQVENIQAIALLDLRLVNQDRHSGNLLVQRTHGNISVIPIDHGCCLPEYDCIADTTPFAWLYWPQAFKPLSAKTKEYIASLSVADQLATFAQHWPHVSFPPKAIVTLHIGTLLVQKCVAIGLNVHEMGLLMVSSACASSSRSNNKSIFTNESMKRRNNKSTLEHMIERALHHHPLSSLSSEGEDHLDLPVFLHRFELILECTLRCKFPAYFAPPSVTTTWLSVPTQKNCTYAEAIVAQKLKPAQTRRLMSRRSIPR